MESVSDEYGKELLTFIPQVYNNNNNNINNNNNNNTVYCNSPVDSSIYIKDNNNNSLSLGSFIIPNDNNNNNINNNNNNNATHVSPVTDKSDIYIQETPSVPSTVAYNNNNNNNNNWDKDRMSLIQESSRLIITPKGHQETNVISKCNNITSDKEYNNNNNNYYNKEGDKDVCVPQLLYNSQKGNNDAVLCSDTQIGDTCNISKPTDNNNNNNNNNNINNNNLTLPPIHVFNSSWDDEPFTPPSTSVKYIPQIRECRLLRIFTRPVSPLLPVIERTSVSTNGTVVVQRKGIQRFKSNNNINNNIDYHHANGIIKGSPGVSILKESAKEITTNTNTNICNIVNTNNTDNISPHTDGNATSVSSSSNILLLLPKAPIIPYNTNINTIRSVRQSLAPRGSIEVVRGYQQGTELTDTRAAISSAEIGMTSIRGGIYKRGGKACVLPGQAVGANKGKAVAVPSCYYKAPVTVNDGSVVCSLPQPEQRSVVCGGGFEDLTKQRKWESMSIAEKKAYLFKDYKCIKSIDEMSNHHVHWHKEPDAEKLARDYDYSESAVTTFFPFITALEVSHHNFINNSKKEVERFMQIRSNPVNIKAKEDILLKSVNKCNKPSKYNIKNNGENKNKKKKCHDDVGAASDRGNKSILMDTSNIIPLCATVVSSGYDSLNDTPRRQLEHAKNKYIYKWMMSLKKKILNAALKIEDCSSVGTANTSDSKDKSQCIPPVPPPTGRYGIVNPRSEFKHNDKMRHNIHWDSIPSDAGDIDKETSSIDDDLRRHLSDDEHHVFEVFTQYLLGSLKYQKSQANTTRGVHGDNDAVTSICSSMLKCSSPNTIAREKGISCDIKTECGNNFQHSGVLDLSFKFGSSYSLRGLKENEKRHTLSHRQMMKQRSESKERDKKTFKYILAQYFTAEDLQKPNIQFLLIRMLPLFHHSISEDEVGRILREMRVPYHLVSKKVAQEVLSPELPELKRCREELKKVESNLAFYNNLNKLLGKIEKIFFAEI